MSPAELLQKNIMIVVEKRNWGPKLPNSISYSNNTTFSEIFIYLDEFSLVKKNLTNGTSKQQIMNWMLEVIENEIGFNKLKGGKIHFKSTIGVPPIFTKSY